MKRENFAPCARAGGAPRIDTAPLLLDHPRDAVYGASMITRLACDVPAPAKSRWRQNLDEAWRRSQTQNQVMVLAIQMTVVEASRLEEYVAPQHHHIGADEVSGS
jgi:hypothetical protein